VTSEVEDQHHFPAPISAIGWTLIAGRQSLSLDVKYEQKLSSPYPTRQTGFQNYISEVERKQ